MYWVAVVGVILLSTLSSQSRSTANNNNYKINPKPCWVNGLEGTCMFVWECINSEGRHVGMCVDTFMFGSCCAHNLTTNQLDMLPDPSEPAVLFTQPKLPQQHQRPNNNNNNNVNNHNVNNHNKPQVTAATAPVSRPYANTHTNTADLHSTSRPTSSHAYGHSQSPSSGTHGHSQSPSSWTSGHSQSPLSGTSGHSQSPSSWTSGHSQSPSSGTSGDSPFNVNTVLAVNNNKPGRPNLSNEISSHHHHHYNQLGPPEPHPPPQLAMYNGGGGYNDRDRNHNNNSHSHSHSHSHLHSHSHNHFRPHNDLVNSDDSDNDINVNGDSHHSSYHHHRPHHNHHHHSHSYGGGLYSVNNRTMELERPMSNDLVMGLGRPGPAGATHSSTSHPHDHVTSDNVAASTSPSMSSPLTTTSFVSVSSSRPMLSPFNGGSIPSTLTHSGTKPQFVTYQFTTTTSAPLSSHKPSWNLTLLDSMNEIDDGSNKQSTESSWFRPRPSWYVTSQPFVTRPRPSSGIRPVKPQRPNYQSQSQSPHTISTSSSSSTSPSSSPSTSMSMSPSTSPSTTTMSTTTASPSPSTVASTTEAPSMVVFSSLPLVVTASDNKKKPQSPQPSSVSSSGSGTPVSASSHKGTMCGSSPLHPKHEVRIVGGRNAQFGVWPWQVSVRRTSFFGFSSTHRCGGALLNENWIATAGHCVDDLLASQIRIRVGEYDFSSVQEPYPFAERGVSKKMVHPKYNFFTYEYDLAMVRLDSPLEFAPHIIPICLPGSDDLLIGENATVTGWGRLSEGGTLPSVLQEVSVPIMSNEKCKSMFLRAGRHEFIPDIFMCAGFDDGGRDSCQGDSGGPLQVRGKDGKYFLAGIISWGIGCAEANLPGVCTRISKFVPWILETVT